MGARCTEDTTAAHPIPSHPIPSPADETAGTDLGAAAAALARALEARDAARHGLATARAEGADLACRLARVEGVAEERLHHLEGAYQTIARLTPEADRTPAPLIRQGPTWREKLRAAWPWPRRARP